MREGSPRRATIIGMERDDKILQVLAEGPARTAEIAERSGLSPAAVKRGLGHLKEAEYIYAPTRGVYRLTGRALSEAAASVQPERPPAPSTPPASTLEPPTAPIPPVPVPTAVGEAPASPVAAPPPAYERLPTGSIRPTASRQGSEGEPQPERSWRRPRVIRVEVPPSAAAPVQPATDRSASEEPAAPPAGLPGWVALVGGGAVVAAILGAYLLSGARGAPPSSKASPPPTGDPWGNGLGRPW